MLNGLFINYDVTVGAWFGGLIGLWIAQYALACFILWVRLQHLRVRKAKLTVQVFPVPGMKVNTRNSPAK